MNAIDANTIGNFDELHRLAAIRFPGRGVQVKDGQMPHLHLFHAANSICSQKVRAVLLATGQAFVSHPLDIFKGDSYSPDYVRLRMLGCVSAGTALAMDHPGSTSTTTTGCDACVVPTLSETQSKRVLVDSKNICIELDRWNRDAPSALVPKDMSDEIDEELSIVDNFPNYQLGVAATIGRGETTHNGLALSKSQRCDEMISKYSDDEVLCTAYAAKRAKEEAASGRLFDATALDRAHRVSEDTLQELDGRLKGRDGPFLYGPMLTMADLFWAVQLIRLDDLGMSSLWANGNLTALDAYYRRIFQIPAVVGSVTQRAGGQSKVETALRD